MKGFDLGTRFKNKREKFVLSISWIILSTSALLLVFLLLLPVTAYLLNIDIKNISESVIGILIGATKVGIIIGIIIDGLHGLVFEATLSPIGLYVNRGPWVRITSLVTLVLIVALSVLIFK